jgi:hypothetical protein
MKKPPVLDDSAGRSWRTLLLINVTLFFLLLAISEGALRFLNDEYRWLNFLDKHLLFSDRSDIFFEFDPVTGWRPRPGFDDGKHLILEEGLRSNGHAVNGPYEILVTGDSYAFGDGVENRESWPAVLERLTARSIANAGVPAFGLDQSTLRAEILAQKYDPKTVILSFIHDDINRSGLKVREGMRKAYFTLQDEKLNVSWPMFDKGETYASTAANIFGYSYFAYRTLIAIDPTHSGNQRFVKSGEDAMAISCRLMSRLAVLKNHGRRRVIVLAQYTFGLTDRRPQKILQCAVGDASSCPV